MLIERNLTKRLFWGLRLLVKVANDVTFEVWVSTMEAEVVYSGGSTQ